MTDRDKSTLEYTEKMCEYCCNFDKEHIGMDGTALCKLTMTLAYAEDYGGNCMFYNVPKEQIIVPPCKVGQTVFCANPHQFDFAFRGKILSYSLDATHLWFNCHYDNGFNIWHPIEDFGKTVFLAKEEAEEKLKEREGK